MRSKSIFGIAALPLACVLLQTHPAGATDREPPLPADALSATINTTDAERFAALWKKTNGNPTAAQIDAEYINGAGRGVEIYIPSRIVDGANMVKQIAAERQLYEQAVGKCLPWVPALNTDLRSIYLAIKGLLPEKPLPQVYMVVGGANSGGTSGPSAQVLGLEILCRDAPTPEQFRMLLRNFFAHETAHTFQGRPKDNVWIKDPLLTQVLVEGGADYIASIVTGEVPDAKREAFGRAHEAEIWSQFVKDRPLAARGFTSEKGFSEAGEKVRRHWLYPQGDVLPGWEPDMGYWLGMQIARAYVEQAADRHAAIRELLALQDPAEILRKSGYANKFRR